MSDHPRDLIWIVERADDGTLRYYEHSVELDGGILVGDDDWFDPGIDAETLAERVAGGIDPSLDNGEWNARVVAAGWVFETPDWWPPIDNAEDAVEGGAS